MAKYFKKYKILLTMWFLGEFGYALSMVYWSFFMKRLADVAFGGILTDVRSLIIFGIGFLVLFFTVQYFRLKSRAKFLKEANSALKYDVFSSIVAQDINLFNDSNSAKYISILNNDLKAIDEDYFRNVPEIIASIILIGVATITMFYYNPILALVTILLNFIPLTIPTIMEKIVSRKRELYSESLETFNANIKDIFTGFEMIKSYNVESKVKARYNNIVDDVEDKMYEYRKKEGLSYTISYTMSYLTGVAQLSFSVYLIVKGYINMGILMGTMQISNYISNPAREASNMLIRYKSVKPILNRVSNLLEEPIDIKKMSLLKSLTPIKIENLCFCYEEGKKVLDDVFFVFEKDKKYAIVGESGSGKSTLVKLIMRYYDEFQGNIYLGNQEIREIDKNSLYKNISMIHQKVVLFDDSIKNNVTMYEEYLDDEVINAISDAGLDKLIKQHKDGIYAKVEEGGRNFSGGEQQRFAIARAFIRKTPVIILDESTSNLDNQTAYQIENIILNRENLTAIVVTHKLDENILNRYDCILVLKNGRIIEHGHFDQLIEKQGYLYNLYNANKFNLQESMIEEY